MGTRDTLKSPLIHLAGDEWVVPERMAVVREMPEVVQDKGL